MSEIPTAAARECITLMLLASDDGVVSASLAAAIASAATAASTAKLSKLESSIPGIAPNSSIGSVSVHVAAEGITATSTETDPIEELGAIPGIDDSSLESFAVDAAVAAEAIAAASEAEGSSDAESIKVMHSLAAAVGISLILA